MFWLNESDSRMARLSILATVIGFAAAHLCTLQPLQRGGAAGAGSEHADVCFQTTGPCPVTQAGAPAAAYVAGQVSSENKYANFFSECGATAANLITANSQERKRELRNISASHWCFTLVAHSSAGRHRDDDEEPGPLQRRCAWQLLSLPVERSWQVHVCGRLPGHASPQLDAVQPAHHRAGR